MDFSELIARRQSVRRYDPRPVEPEMIGQCLEAARLAPSASNSQPWHFIVVDEPSLKEQVARATFDRLITFNRFTLEAPAIVVMVAEKARLVTRLGAALQERDFTLIDHGIAAAHFCLAAAEQGLGTCMLGWFNQRKIKMLLNIPPGRSISLLITVGYPPEGYRLRVKSRKTADLVFSRNGYPKGRTPA